jgi:hypothetical protein
MLFQHLCYNFVLVFSCFSDIANLISGRRRHAVNSQITGSPSAENYRIKDGYIEKNTPVLNDLKCL